MPELPEVERARKLIAETCTGYEIEEVDTVEDTIVYEGVTPTEFADELRGRTILGCERKGKQFWIVLSGEGRFPVMHFGMTGMIQIRGHEPTWYRRKINLGETSDSWPPRFHKLTMKLNPPPGLPVQELAFIDPRRLGRLRLLPHPVLDHPPLSDLGFDPVLSHPTFDEFKALLSRKKGSIKGVIMDQGFSAGVGNWVADEVLYQARIHPLHPVPDLEEAQLVDLHRLLRDIPTQAIAVNADSSLFPDNWLFNYRWDKGKKKKKGKGKNKDTDTPVVEEKFLALPDGTRATITFVTVAGRTSAVVTQLQKLPAARKAVVTVPAKRKASDTQEVKNERLVKEEVMQEPIVEQPPNDGRRRSGRITRATLQSVTEAVEVKRETTATRATAKKRKR